MIGRTPADFSVQAAPVVRIPQKGGCPATYPSGTINRMSSSHSSSMGGDKGCFEQRSKPGQNAEPMDPSWIDSSLGSILRDLDGTVLTKIRPLVAGGVSARWTNGLTWDVSDIAPKGPGLSDTRWFATLRLAKAAVMQRLARERLTCVPVT